MFNNKSHFCYLILFLFISCEVIVSYDGPIEHVIVLMMENRSFDHMLGFLHEDIKDIDGLDGTEYQLTNTSDPSSTRVYVNKHGYDEGPDDPGHSFNDTAEEIYGFVKLNNETATPKMSGFVQNAIFLNHNISNPMSMFTKDNDSAPIINTLAQEYAVFNYWYCSVPGPTDPNRAFAMSGTSNGMNTNFNGTLWSQQSYFDFLTQHNIDWKGYYGLDPWALFYFNDTANNPENAKNLKEMTEFYLDINHRDYLAQFTWLQPRMNAHIVGPPNWQHPDASVKEGERLIKEVYESVRNSKFWNSTALIITYDEHGGFYDHVTPPQTGVPPPDHVLTPDGFNFDRLGIRIPTVVISPWIKKGTIVNDPTGPTQTSKYEGTSSIATASKIFGITEHLTNRTAWAGTFEHLFEQTNSPRQDCIKELPHIEPWTKEDLINQRNKKLNDHLEIQIQFYCKFNNHDLSTCGKNIVNQGQASDFLSKQAKIYMNNLLNNHKN